MVSLIKTEVAPRPRTQGAFTHMCSKQRRQEGLSPFYFNTSVFVFFSRKGRRTSNAMSTHTHKGRRREPNQRCVRRHAVVAGVRWEPLAMGHATLNKPSVRSGGVRHRGQLFNKL
jgi:hypothetical protein